jgi:hypothetical protein
MVLKKRPKIVASITILSIVVAMNVVVDNTCLTRPDIIVDFSGDSYPASTRATGFLFGLQNGTPADDLITALLPQTYRFNQHVDVWDRVHGLNQLLPLPIRPVVVVSDRYGFPPLYGTNQRPGSNGNWSAWETLVAREVTMNLAWGRNGTLIYYDIWNEPDYWQFWDGTFEEFCETWYRGASIIRALDPTAMLVGPSFAYFNLANIRSFLDYIATRNASLIPDVLTWHEVNDRSYTIEPRVEALRSMLETSGYASAIDQIHLHEYGADATMFSPGPNLHTIAAIDRAQLDGATRAIVNSRSWWDDTMDNLLTPGLQPTVIWQVYKAYADMTRANATMYSISSNVASVDGLISIDAGNTVRCILGNNESASMRLKIRFDNLPRGTTLTRYRLLVFDLPNLGETPYLEPVLIQEQVITLQGNSIDYSTTIAEKGAISMVLVPV